MSDNALSGRDLDRAIAEAMGWTFYARNAGEDDWYATHDGTYRNQHLPSFSTSLDALSEGPEKVLRETGLTLIVGQRDGWYAVWEQWDVQHHNDLHDYEGESNISEAEARALAALAALRALVPAALTSEEEAR